MSQTESDQIQFDIQNQDSQYQHHSPRQKKAKSCLWTQYENKIYAESLRQIMPLASDLHYRKKIKIFKVISAKILTRTPTQVKTHHQKIMAKFQTISAFLAHFDAQMTQSTINSGLPKGFSKLLKPKKTMVEASTQVDWGMIERQRLKEDPQYTISETKGWENIDDLLDLD